MSQANLSEVLFKPRFKHPETSTLVRRFNHGAQPSVQSATGWQNHSALVSHGESPDVDLARRRPARNP